LRLGIILQIIMTVVPLADSDLRRCHMYLYASVPDFILQNNLAAKIMLFNIPVNNLSYRIEFWLFVDNRLLKINLLADG
jgi:hypothetical protein